MDKSVSVAEYCRTFCERVAKGTYGEKLEDNRRVAGEQFVSLVIKIQEAGSKDDIKVPLRVLRDEIGRAFFSGVGHKKAENIESLFSLYDALEASCQNTLKAGRMGDQKDSTTAAQLLEELRIRFVRLAVGETWEKFPELKFLALKRMYKYMVKEQQALRMKGKLALGGAASGSGRFNAKFMRTLSLQPSGASGATWQSALEDLVKAPSNKLFPFVKLLLAENSLLQSSAASAEPNGLKAKDKQTSVSKDEGAVGRGTSDFSLDDLLGLGPESCETPNAAPTFSDPFQPSPVRSGSQGPAAHTSEAPPAFEAAFPEHHQDSRPAPQAASQPAAQPAPQQPKLGSNNPFGASSFGAKAFPGPSRQTGQAPARVSSSGAGYPVPATPAPSLATGASADANVFPSQPAIAGLPSRTSSGIPASPTHPASSSVGRRTTSSEAEVPPPVPAQAGASSEGFDDHAFETSFPPVAEHAQTFTGSGRTANPSPFVKAPPGPVRQLSGRVSGLGSGQLGRAGSGMGSGQLPPPGSGTFSPPMRTASSGMQPAAAPEGNHPHSASLDAGSGGFPPTHDPSQGPAAAPPVSSANAPATNGGISGQSPLQRAGPGSGSTNSGSQSFTPMGGTGFEEAAFPGSPTAAPPASTASPQQQGSGAKATDAGFNPFGLPSPSFASPVPVTADNRFADVSPMADAPPPFIPAPMRAPPAPPTSGGSGKFSAW
ncbi:hypothetical protein CVIRNUC_003770 [Coccomyxa viridis]|uniref:Uncharacterized protein n=1 Tax=Coccomyxa viridis TaxID=1274662 RepID=A0AAV1I276_9CHLO|nr:hypothetical protein CVIRNUC_003770 [Coccomyxa viridis]